MQVQKGGEHQAVVRQTEGTEDRWRIDTVLHFTVLYCTTWHWFSVELLVYPNREDIVAWTLDLMNLLTECAVHSVLSYLRVILDQCQSGCNSVRS
jgi:hypothetical protein